ncbi:MAG TPA: acyl-CoA dehydrogenase family protein [Aggregatilineales bacterium]|nr:acyl-CoA dehydrogenase family protein [Anaerolineales bacterium]HRE48578.1 acyl-CoA dehydrogenase family protein [Aggregatilineales bacterium]
MDFLLNDDHLMAQKVARDFAHKEIRPTIKDWDRKQELNPAVLPRMGELGILGISIPARYGGQGYDYVTLGLVCEELERVDTTLRVIMSVHMGLNSLALLQWGTEAQKQTFLAPQARGEKYAGFCLTEPGVGSDVVNMRTSAKRQGDTYILNGEKMWISLATKAHHFLVVAKTDPAAGHKGMTAFIVTRDMKGVTTGDIHGKLGVRAGSTGWVAMQDVEVPAENRLGEEGEGFYIAMSCLDNGRYTVAAGATGLIRACLEDSLAYSMSRSTFGKEIARHQLIQQKIGFMQQWYDAARLLYLKAGFMKNRGLRNTRETGMAKWYATDHSVQAALEAIQLHGAYGFSDEYDVERYLRNSKGATIYEGTSEIHQLMQAEYALGFRQDRPLRCEMPAYNAESWQAESVGA